MNPARGRDLRDGVRGRRVQGHARGQQVPDRLRPAAAVAMYVDKQLSGVTAVQTLSRLNRTYRTRRGAKDARRSSSTSSTSPRTSGRRSSRTSPTPSLETATDPNLVHDLATKLDAAGIYTEAEVDARRRRRGSSGKGNNALSAAIGPAKQRLRATLRTQRSHDGRQGRARRARPVPQGRRHLRAALRLHVPDHRLRRHRPGEAVDLPAPPRTGDPARQLHRPRSTCPT